jgi:hypothetical protein
MLLNSRRCSTQTRGRSCTRVARSCSALDAGRRLRVLQLTTPEEPDNAGSQQEQRRRLWRCRDR